MTNPRTSSNAIHFLGHLSYLTVLIFAALCFLGCPFVIWALNNTPIYHRSQSEVAKVPLGTVSRRVETGFSKRENTGGTFQTEFGVFMTSGRKTTIQQCKFPEVPTPSQDLREEALAALHVAVSMEACGKLRKAHKLFKHAVALDPSNSNILTEYGTFLEQHHKDVLKADTLYLRAVYADPKNQRALSMRARVEPLVEEIDQKSFDRIDDMMREFDTIPEWDIIMVRKKRAAFVWQLYHSVAIEGNTMTFLETMSVLENRLAIAGKSIMEHNEILGMDAALHFMNDSLVRRTGPIHLLDILDMHLRILGFNDPVNAGKFRSSQVYISDHVPPGAGDVPALMEEFVDWMNSAEAAQMHPIKLATLAHYFMVHIHPFVDGNGRVGRLLMNLILMRSGYPPVVIRVNERTLYYQCLKDANAGDIRPFIRFITQCMEMTLKEYLYSANDGDMFNHYPSFLLPGESSHEKIFLPAADMDERIFPDGISS
ncbi:Adenosine monophosphate-protein transferase FICD-like protein [Hypsibius exemplaris]|uniref:protein adenylyltransferase n=1 Tax=Hypsibius exemplaris TaxID=2072580 RepID=A0A9X6RKY6_HYPEX|nr:Adenosine monophosphate-protein transferase FICD-like protein [Hypsibius exemplaris]